MCVSILIPCYNAEQWIAAAIESALAQTWPDKEVIVVDDGSTDGSLEVIQSFGDRIHWETGRNRGGNVARNRLLELASGEWLQYLDADDWLKPEHVANQMAVAAASPTADVVYSPGIMEYRQEAEGEPARHEVLAIPEPHDPWILLIRWYLPQTGAALWRRRAIAAAGGWKTHQPCCQEHELYLRLLAHGATFVFAPKPGAVYRQWSTDTVCRKNPLTTFKHRLAVVDDAERHLRATSALLDSHAHSLALTRLECARSIYMLDRAFACSTAAKSGVTGSPTLPHEPAFPWAYRMSYSLLGFRMSERLALSVRMVRDAVRHTSPAKARN